MAFGRKRGLTPAPRPASGAGSAAAGRALPGRLRRAIGAARRLIILEGIAAALGPPLALLALYACAALLGLPPRLGAQGLAILFLLVLLLAAGLFAWGLYRRAWPDERAARRRLTRASGWRHDPLGALEDDPAAAGPDARALWQAHQARSLAATRRPRLGLPWPWRARRRNLALSGGVLAALLACLWIAGPAIWPRLVAAAAISPGALLGPPAPPPSVTAWITPPGYTGRPPVLLPAGQRTLDLPVGSRLDVTVSGLRAPPRLSGIAAAFKPVDARSFTLEARLGQSGLYILRGGGRALARWKLMVQPDSPPEIGFAEPPGTAADGHSLRLPWHATDDYAVTAAEMRARLVAHPEAPPLVLKLALPDGPAATIDTTTIADLSANPWAGLPVRMQLRAEDGAGQTGRSAIETVTLPERHFHDPFAQETIAIRRELVVMPSPLTPDLRAAGAHAMFEVAAAALAAGKPPKTVLPLMAAGWQLAADGTPGVLPTVEQTLWQVALHFEQGDAADTAQSLAGAAAALSQALAGGQASPQALSALVRQMQAAMLQHLSTLMQMAEAEGGQVAPGSAGGQPLDLRQMAAEMRAMRAAAKTGDLGAMRAAMAALQRSLTALEQARVVRPNPAQMAARAQAARDLGSLQSLMQQQAALLDRATARASAAAAAHAEGAPPPAGGNPAAAQDAAAQAALRQKLGGMAGRLGPAGNTAGNAMGQAALQLSLGADGAAAGAQKQALFALQQAADAIGQRLARGAGGAGGFMIGGAGMGGQPGAMPGFGFFAADPSTDPLGRPLDNGQGSSIGADMALPTGSAEQARLRAILQELRARAGDRSLSKPALDYIERLLQPF
ncbi:DUF4175 family protein [Acidisoma sp. C75]